MKKIIFLLLFLVAPNVTLAHSPLESVYPIDGSSLKMALPKIEMVFKSPAKLIKFDMYEVSSTKKTKLLSKLMGSKKGEEISLNKDFLLKISKKHTIALPFLENGDYVIFWRAIGEDGHIVKGKFSFELDRN
jgi:methionine-rich copper-binding protein CopC